MVSQPQQRPQLVRVELLDAHRDIVLEHKIEKDLLLGAELRVDVHPRMGGADFPRDGRPRIGDVREHVEEIARLGVNDALHLGELLQAKAMVGQAL